MATNDPAHESVRVWMEDGIIYSEFHGDFSLKSILESEQDVLALLQKHQKGHAPAIVVMDKVTDDKVKLGIADFGKVVSGGGIVKHLSAILIVGASDQSRKIIGMINRVFFSNKIKFFENLEEAQAVAREHISSSLSILEQN